MPQQLQLAVAASAIGNDPRRVAAAARRLGVSGILFDAFSTGLSLPELSQTGRREFYNMVRSHDRQIAGLAVDLGQHGLSPKADVDQQFSRIEKTMDAARSLSAPLVCVELGPLPAPSRSETSKPKVSPELAGLILIPSPAEIAAAANAAPALTQSPADVAFIGHLDPVMTELGHRADRYGVMLAFRSELASVAAVERAIHAAACPWFGVDLDPVALLRDDADLDATFDRLGPLIRHVRARDAITGSAGRSKPAPVGQGGVNWPHVLSNLNAAGYHQWITIDPVELPDRLGATTAAAGYLSKLTAPKM